MCGRYAASRDVQEMLALYDVSETDAPTTLLASYNIAPTQDTYIVDQHEEHRRLRVARWGLVPAWSRDASGAARLINARSETVSEKPSFKAAFARRRCIVPMDGWYEWQGPGKQPWYLSSIEGMSAVAGIHEWWRPPNADPNDAMSVLQTMAILTTTPSNDIAHVHDRMPVVLGRDDIAAWLDPSASIPELQHLLRPSPVGTVRSWKVSRAVSQVRNNDPSLILPMESDDASPGSEQQALW
jgi:putative SOS response-associated peptidase YedK